MSDTGNRSDVRDRQLEAEGLIRMLQETMTTSEFQQFENELLHPEMRAERLAREAEEEWLRLFWIDVETVPAGYVLPVGFEEMWEQLIQLFEQETRERFISGGTKPEHLDSFIKRGWVTADLAKLCLKTHLKKPADKLHPIPALLVNDEGNWKAPEPLNRTIKVHPFIRAVTESMPELTVEEQIAKAIKRASTYRESNNHHGTILAQSGVKLELHLDEKAFGESEDFAWMQAAKGTEHFWRILDAAIGFGRSLANHEIYGDGTVEGIIQRSQILGSGKRSSEWRLVIERELLAERQETGKVLTPAQLRKQMGANPPGSKDEILTFVNQKYLALPPIKWKEFQIRAKKAAEKLDL